MKLRSGKIVKQPLPTILEKKLNEDLQTLKELLANNEEFAKELITTITTAPSGGHYIVINQMIREQFKEMEQEEAESFQELLTTANLLLSLIIGNNSVYQEYNIEPIYHDNIQAIMEDTFLIGLTNQLDNMEI